ncbi:hypothetical protein NKG94_45210 [Micromonospora sp. M12]
MAKPLVPYPRRSVVASAAGGSVEAGARSCRRDSPGQSSAQRRGRRDGQPEQAGAASRGECPWRAGRPVIPAPTAARTRPADGSRTTSAWAAPYLAAYHPASTAGSTAARRGR